MKRARRGKRVAAVHIRRAGGPRVGSDAELVRAVRAALEHGGRPDLAVEVVLVTDRALAALHGRFLADPSPTDVMAFDLGADASGPGGGGGPEAEIYASPACARRVARERGVTPARELALYLVHGALHLCGHDDHAPRARARMRRAEAQVLRALGYADDPGAHA